MCILLVKCCELTADSARVEQYKVYFKLTHPDLLDKYKNKTDRPSKHNVTFTSYASLHMKSPYDFRQ